MRSGLRILFGIATAVALGAPAVLPAGASVRGSLNQRPSISGAIDQTVSAKGGRLAIVLHVKQATGCSASIRPQVVIAVSSGASCRAGLLQLKLDLPGNTRAAVRSYRIVITLRGRGGSAQGSFNIIQLGGRTSTVQGATSVQSPATAPNTTGASSSAPPATASVSVGTSVPAGSDPPTAPAAPQTPCPATAVSNGGAIPASVGYCNGIAFSDYGNTFWGDCTLATAGDLEQAFDSEIGGASTPLPEQSVIAQYQQLSGATTANPNVAVANLALVQQWENGGIASTQIANWTIIDATNNAAVAKAVWQLGGLYTSVEMPSADLQTPIGATWSLDSTPAGSPSSGDHAMALVGFDASNVYFVAWGHLQAATWGWWDTFANVAVGVLPAQFVAAGHGPVSSLAQMNMMYFDPPTQ